jgi:hypothetical protein
MAIYILLITGGYMLAVVSHHIIASPFSMVSMKILPLSRINLRIFFHCEFICEDISIGLLFINKMCDEHCCSEI